MRLLLPILCALLPGMPLSAADPIDPPPGAPASTAAAHALPLGCWRGLEHPDMVVLFEKDRLFLQQEGRTVQAPVVWEPGAFTMTMMGQQARVPYTCSGDRLTITVGGQQVAFTRSPTIPASIRDASHPFVLGTGVADAARIAAVQHALAQRQATDQAVRVDPQRRGEMAKVDADDTAYIRAQVAEIGWIDVPRFGVAASTAAFLLVQHSGDMPLMQAVLPAIERDVVAKHLPDGQSFALLYDRVQLFQGKPQRYGSQIITTHGGEMVLYQLEDPAHVDRRRAAIGMEPLADYLRNYASANGGKGVAMPSL